MSPKQAGGMYQQPSAQLHMTPQLRQALRVLQLSTPDLLDHIQHELEANPFLQCVDLERDGNRIHRGVPAGGRFGWDPVAHVAANEQTLESHLNEQLRFTSGLTSSIQRIIRFLIGNLDPSGYLVLTIERIAEALHVDPDQVEQALHILQGFEPTGVGARDVRECLLLQVRASPRLPDLAQTIIRHHLEDVAHDRVAKLAKGLHTSAARIREAIDAIRTLNPRPGAVYQRENVHYIVPDVLFDKAGELFAVSLYAAAVPRVAIDDRYAGWVKQRRDGDNGWPQLRDHLQSAMLLIKSLEQRRHTLLRVARAIADEQADFFHQGVAGLKPMNLRQIGHKIGLHESTVSRAVAGKYAQTPWGVFPMSFFFPSGSTRGMQEQSSDESVKQKIREWVKLEDRGKPYSDRQLADMLAAEGIPVARRTVAKYREALGILSSVRRKRLE